MESALIVECPGIGADGRFLPAYTGRGEDVSPEFRVGNLPPQAQSLVVILEDLSHPIKGFTHWVAWNLPAAERVPAAIPAGKTVPGSGAVQGLGYGLHRYAGPKPPKGKTHQYRFTLYALDCLLDLPPFSSKRRVLKKAKGHILGRGEVCGHFQ